MFYIKINIYKIFLPLIWRLHYNLAQLIFPSELFVVNCTTPESFWDHTGTVIPSICHTKLAGSHYDHYYSTYIQKNE